MGNLYRYFIFFLSLCIGVLFLYSAYTKMFPIQSFEYTLGDSLHIDHQSSSILARLITGFEACIGCLVFLQVYGRKKWVLRSAFLLVAVFSVYLIWLWAVRGNNVNCGCFGDSIWMSPSVSLLKNVLLMLAIGLVNKYLRGMRYTWLSTAIPIFFLAGIASVFVFVPVFKPYPLNFSALYADKANTPAIDLSKGKHIIAFLSPSCIHCRRAAALIKKMEADDSTLPIYMVIGGTKGNIDDFWKASGAEQLPHCRLAVDPFYVYTHRTFPTILWVNNGLVEAETSYPDLTTALIKKWMK